MTYWQPSIYERNQLLKYGFSETDFAKVWPMPVEYLTLRVSFAGLEIKINPNVLIPRVETEELVELISVEVAAAARPPRILEIATGSGAITAAVLHRHQHQLAGWWASDISNKALLVARENLKAVYKKDDLDRHLFLSDLLSRVPVSQTVSPSHAFQVDLLVANLPYLPTSTLATLEPSVRDFEPLLALDGGKDGFIIIDSLLRQILHKEILTGGGIILLEVDMSHDLYFIRKHYPWILNYYRVRAVKDQFGRQRFLRLVKLAD